MTRRRRPGFWRISWLALFGYWGAPPAVLGVEASVPGDHHFAALEQAKDCGIYRAVAEKVRRESESRDRAVAEVRELLRQRREALEGCAGRNGLKSVGTTEDEDRILAEVCNREYVEWLAPGYRLRVLKLESREGQQALGTLAAVAQYRCAGLGAAEPREAGGDLSPEGEENPVGEVESPASVETAYPVGAPARGTLFEGSGFEVRYPIGAPSREALLGESSGQEPVPVVTSADRASRGPRRPPLVTAARAAEGLENGAVEWEVVPPSPEEEQTDPDRR